jgi:hypothetical protein
MKVKRKVKSQEEIITVMVRDGYNVSNAPNALEGSPTNKSKHRCNFVREMTQMCGKVYEFNAAAGEFNYNHPIKSKRYENAESGFYFLEEWLVPELESNLDKILKD